ncbi:MAG TPA: SulP family inorganic anion transporter [Chlamydiales bacterium]|nr:SulP family inorganic anion transporter [Chlamydiales bacterium]
MRIPNRRSISFAPFLDEIRTYTFPALKNDLLAAIAVALMTIPQSIAYAILADLPPTAGLFSAIFGTIFTAAFGSSRQLISGPSTGTAILLQTSIANVLYIYFPEVTGSARDALVLHILTQFVILMGLIQVGSSFFNVSKLLQFVSRPVILGYFAGITVAIAVTQAFGFTGIKPIEANLTILFQGLYLVLHLNQIHLWTVFIGVISFTLLLWIRSRFANWPNALLMIVIATLVTKGLHYFFGIGGIKTLGSFDVPDEPMLFFTFPLLNFDLLPKIFPASLALAFLSILEVFSISRAFAAKYSQSITPNQDVFSVGLSNSILACILGSMPASGSATRTTLNVRFSAKTRFAAIYSGLITGAILFFCWPLVKGIPLAALAAILIATAHTLMDWNEIRFSIKATRADAWVFFLTFLACLFFTLDVAFFIGIVISIGNYLKKSAMPHLVEYAFNSKGRLIVVTPKEDVHRKVRIIGIGGNLYFATADVFQEALEAVAGDKNVQAIVLRLNNVHHMDASMCLAIMRLFETLHTTGRYLVISGLTEEVWHVFHRAGMVKKISLDNLYFTDESNPQFSTWKACLRAQELIHKH